MYNLDDEQLDERKERAIFLLMEGRSDSEIAAELGVNRSTIYRWKKEDELFQEELIQLKRSAWKAGENKLLMARAAAIDEAIDLLAHENPRIKLQAINIILRFDVNWSMSGAPMLRRSR